jgi:hypothetical protein
MRWIALLPIVILLSGCVSDKERAAQQRALAQQINRRDDDQCRSYGATPGTDQYIKCRMMIAQQRDAADAQRNAAVMQYLLANKPTPYQIPVAPASPNLNCTTSRVGDQAYTHCN